MRRIQLAEIHDQPWFPRTLRDLVTESLQSILTRGHLYAPIVPLLWRTLERTKTQYVVDLCSGAGGPWPWLHQLSGNDGRPPLHICLTDKYPNAPALERARVASHDDIQFRPDPVDATNIPAELRGFRTVFSSFHHFRPSDARAMLQDAVDKQEGIGIFEAADRNLLTIFLVFLVPIVSLVLATITRPFRWSRLVWTCFIPVIPIVLFVDGIISCMRTYSPAELRELTEELSSGGYRWEIGRTKGRFMPISVTYLVGYPNSTPFREIQDGPGPSLARKKALQSDSVRTVSPAREQLKKTHTTDLANWPS